MKTIGIIAEFNPFHNGHKYLFAQAKEQFCADFCVVVMSGSFVQRGAPSCMYKFTRVQAALISGADLVLEMPVSYSTATAEVFCYGGISILNSLGIIDEVLFGSESGDIVSLSQCADALLNPTQDKIDLVYQNLAKGCNYPAARAMAYPEYSSILSMPNNILALEYIKALRSLNSGIIPRTIRRTGSDYHELSDNEYSSAEGIREIVSGSDEYPNLKGIPRDVSLIYEKTYKKSWPIYLDDYSQFSSYMLLTHSAKDLSVYQDMTADIAQRFKKAEMSYDSLSEFLSSQKTKELTYTRLSRAMLHIILNLKDLTKDEGKLIDVPFTRILGFRADARELMHAISHSSSIPLINKMADARKLIPPSGYPLFEATVCADRLYDYVVKQKYGTHLKDGCLISPIII